MVHIAKNIVLYTFYEETNTKMLIDMYVVPGVCIFLCVMVAVLVFMYKHVKRQRGNFEQILVGNPGNFNPSREWKKQLSTIGYDTTYELAKSEFKIGEEIGSGNFGKVNKGELMVLSGT